LLIGLGITHRGALMQSIAALHVLYSSEIHEIEIHVRTLPQT